MHTVELDSAGCKQVLILEEQNEFWNYMMTYSISQAQPQTLAKYLSITYYNIRMLLFALAVLLPLILWVWSSVTYGNWRPGVSISGYYHAESIHIHDLFVGMLVSVGVLLIGYRGFTLTEDWLLNLGGICIIIVALVPTSKDQAPNVTLQSTNAEEVSAQPEGIAKKVSPKLSAHGTSAVAFFICLALVAWTQSEQSLKLLENEASRKKYRRIYRILAILMVALPAVCWLWLRVFNENWGIFAIESLGVWTFAAYWLVKTTEFTLHDK